MDWVNKINTLEDNKLSKSNKSGHSNIFWSKCHSRWLFRKIINGKVYTMSNKELDKVIEYKNEFMKNPKNKERDPKNISWHKYNDSWVFRKQIEGKSYFKYSKDLDELIAYKESFTK